MAWLAVDKNEEEYDYQYKPRRYGARFDDETYVELPKGSIEKLIGKPLTWADEPVEIK